MGLYDSEPPSVPLATRSCFSAPVDTDLVTFVQGVPRECVIEESKRRGYVYEESAGRVYVRNVWEEDGGVKGIVWEFTESNGQTLLLSIAHYDPGFVNIREEIVGGSWVMDGSGMRMREEERRKFSDENVCGYRIKYRYEQGVNSVRVWTGKTMLYKDNDPRSVDNFA